MQREIPFKGKDCAREIDASELTVGFQLRFPLDFLVAFSNGRSLLRFGRADAVASCRHRMSHGRGAVVPQGYCACRAAWSDKRVPWPPADTACLTAMALNICLVAIRWHRTRRSRPICSIAPSAHDRHSRFCVSVPPRFPLIISSGFRHLLQIGLLQSPTGLQVAVQLTLPAGAEWEGLPVLNFNILWPARGRTPGEVVSCLRGIDVCLGRSSPSLSIVLPLRAI